MCDLFVDEEWTSLSPNWDLNSQPLGFLAPLQGWKNVYFLASNFNFPHFCTCILLQKKAKFPSNWQNFHPVPKVSLQTDTKLSWHKVSQFADCFSSMHHFFKCHIFFHSLTAPVIIVLNYYILPLKNVVLCPLQINQVQ